jgi:hypothetical protein
MDQNEAQQSTSYVTSEPATPAGSQITAHMQY